MGSRRRDVVHVDVFICVLLLIRAINLPFFIFVGKQQVKVFIRIHSGEGGGSLGGAIVLNFGRPSALYAVGQQDACGMGVQYV